MSKTTFAKLPPTESPSRGCGRSDCTNCGTPSASHRKCHSQSRSTNYHARPGHLGVRLSTMLSRPMEHHCSFRAKHLRPTPTHSHTCHIVQNRSAENCPLVSFSHIHLDTQMSPSLSRTCSQKSGEGRLAPGGGLLPAPDLSGVGAARRAAALLEQLQLTLSLAPPSGRGLTPAAA